MPVVIKQAALLEDRVAIYKAWVRYLQQLEKDRALIQLAARGGVITLSVKKYTLDVRMGVCANADINVHSAVSFTEWVREAWGDAYPVKANKGLTNYRAYGSRQPKYSGTYGDNRFKFIKDSVIKLKRDIKALEQAKKS